MKKALLKLSLLLALVLGGILPSHAEWVVDKTWDFAALAAESADKAGVTYSTETVKCGVDCNKGTDFYEGLAFQGADKWFLYGKNGLYQGNGGGRNFCVLDRKAGDKIVISTDGATFGDPNNATLDSNIDNVYTYTVTADGNFWVSTTRYRKLFKVEVSHNEKDASEVYANYTVKYIDADGNEIKEAATREGLVGSAVELTAADKNPIYFNDKKYIYVSDNTVDMTIAENGETTAIINFREAATYSYTLKSTNPEKELDHGTGFEGDEATACYPAYQFTDGVLTAYPAVNSAYNVVFTLTEDVEKTIAYTASDIENVVFYVEAEDIMDVATGSNALIRCSYGKGGYASQDTVVTTLQPGKYTLTVSTRGGGARDWGFSFKANGDTIYTTANLMGYNQTATSDEFTITKETPIVLCKAGSNNDMVDFIYVQKTGEYVPEIIAVESVTLDKETAELDIDATLQITATVAPADATEQTVTWTSSDPAIATVSEEGLVTAIAAGEATITATCGDKTATCVVTVNKIAQTITWEQDFTAAEEVGAIVALTATASSQLAVAYEITEGTDLAEIQGTNLVVKAAGTIKVVAKQEGNEKYAAAEPVEKTINATSGIEVIEAADAQADFYTLQGVKVATPAAGNVYIRVAAGKATKVYVK